MVDIKKFVETLVKTGMEKAKATEKVKKVIAKIKERKPDATDEEITKLIGRALSAAGTKKEGEKIKGICIGYEGKVDRNFGYAKDALEMYSPSTIPAASPEYKKSRDKALSEGRVKEETGFDGAIKPVVMDMRKFIDKAEKYENRNYGKPLRQSLTRRSYFLIGKDLVTVNGNIDPIIGVEYYIYGKAGKYGFYASAKDGIQRVGAVDKIPLWETVYNFATESDLAVTMDVFSDLAAYDVRLTSAYIKASGASKFGSGLWVSVNSDEVPDGMFMNTANEDVATILSEAKSGAEALLLVRMKPKKTGSFNYQIIGVILNPESSSDAELVDDLYTVIEDGEN